jgi:hypothetical protein
MHIEVDSEGIRRDRERLGEVTPRLSKGRTSVQQGALEADAPAPSHADPLEKAESVLRASSLLVGPAASRICAIAALASGTEASVPSGASADSESLPIQPSAGSVENNALQPLQSRAGQVRFITRPKSRTMRATRQRMLPPSTVVVS